MSDKGLDFEGLAAALLCHSRLLIPLWLPGGSMRGHEYTCGSVRGGPGASFSVNIDTGRWADFADDALRGGDLISLYAAIEGIGQGESAKRLSSQINFSIAPERPVEQPPQIIAPPAAAPAPDMRHGHFGTPSTVWTYRDHTGNTLFYIARYDMADGSKQFVPWCWDRGGRWIKKAWPSPRPIYGLDRLSASPDRHVLIVEGEKAAEAAAALAGDAYVVVSWPGGASAWERIDWTPLHGRRLLLWPDADRHIADTQRKADKTGVAVGAVIPYEYQPGPAAMAGIAGVLHGKAAEIKVLDVGIEPDRKDGWDAADAAAAGWAWDQLVSWAKPRAKIFGPTIEPVAGQIISPTAPAAEGVEEMGDAIPVSLYAEWEKIGIATAQNGSPICNVDNALRVLEGRDEFKEIIWYDEFHKRYLTRFDFETWKPGPAREWCDVDELNLTAFMQRQLGLHRISDDMIHKAAIIYAHKHLRNEPKDWLAGLEWDETPRCETFFSDSMGAENNEYARAASKNFWIGMVARILRPGCKLDNMVVLEGPQGTFKSTALSKIGGPWYTEIKESVTSNDFFMVLHGKLIVEIAELDSFNRAEVTRIKQVVTCTNDRYRSPYARSAQDHPRMSIFVGTTNESAYLRDHTGGRRFWPIRCGDIKLARIEADREQLFAEAVARFKAGENWYEMPAVTANEQEERRQVDEWESIIAEALVERKSITTREVADYLKIDIAKLDMIVQKRIANVLRTLGWEKSKERDVHGRLIRVWREEELPFKA